MHVSQKGRDKLLLFSDHISIYIENLKKSANYENQLKSQQGLQQATIIIQRYFSTLSHMSHLLLILTWFN